MSLNKNILILFFILTGASYSQKENETKDSISTKSLEEVLVTATRTQRQLSSIPLPAQIISKEQIKASNSQRLSDVINEQTGLITIPDIGTAVGLQVQGLDAAYTLVLIDGVPLVGRLGGTLDLRRITIANIKQIEIVKGASSSLYGSEAMGGVINIITDDPSKGLSADLNYRYGTFDTHDATLSIGYKENKLAINSSINRFSSCGFDLDNISSAKTLMPYENFTFQNKVKYDFTEKTSLTLSSRLYNEYQKTNTDVNDQILLGNGKINEWNSTVKLSHKISDKLDVYGEFYATEYQTKSKTNNIDGSLFSSDFFDQFLLRPEVRLQFEPNKIHSVIFGTGFTHETLNRTYFSNKPEFNAPYVYGQYDLNLSNKLNVILGARYDAHNEYEAQFSPKIAARYEFTNKFSVKSSFGYGYKAPDFRQLFLNFTNPSRGYTVLGHNLVTSELALLDSRGEILSISVPLSDYEGDLKPESSKNFNIGFDYNPNNQLRFGVNLFINEIKNLIDTKVVASKTNGQNVFSYYNTDNVYTSGVEFDFLYKPTSQLQLSGGYQLLYAIDYETYKDYDDGNVYIDQFPGRPLKSSQYFGLPNRSRHMANLKIYYKNKEYKFDTNLRATYRSKYGLADTNNNGSIDNFDEFVEGYSIWNLAFNKDIYENYQIGIGVENIFDFTDVRSSEQDQIFINNIPGRILYAKLNINI